MTVSGKEWEVEISFINTVQDCISPRVDACKKKRMEDPSLQALTVSSQNVRKSQHARGEGEFPQNTTESHCNSIQNEFAP